MVTALLFLLVALAVQSGESIKCYQCSSSSDPNCGVSINTNEVEATECSTSGIGELYEHLKKGLKGLTTFMGTDMKSLDLAFACQKIVASDEEGNVGTVRSCTLAKSEGLDPCSLTSQIDKMLNGRMKVDFCEVCESDSCNGAESRSYSSVFFVLIPSLAVLISSWFNA